MHSPPTSGQPGNGGERTLKRRETAIEQQLEIAEVPLGEGQRGEGVGLGGELGLAGSVAGEEVFENPAVGLERHDGDFLILSPGERRIRRP